MNKGGIWLVSAVLACSACVGDQGKLEIRSVDRGIKGGSEPVPFRIAEARGHLALGNVALALEGFRKAARDDPVSMEALAGMADCYARMTRFDLARRYYEAALAVAPQNPALLASFAAMLERQGLKAEANAVRTEIAVLASAAPPQGAGAALPSLASSAVAVDGAPGPAEIAAPEPVGRSVTVALPPARPMGEPVARTSPAQAMAVAPVGKSVTIALPPPRPAPAARSAERSPRLERLSLAEVALVTGSGLRWKRVEQPKMAMARGQSAQLRVLNAARVSKLAARTRSYLHNLGWGEVMIGDAVMARTSSLILYPQGKRAEARRLSASLGFATAQRASIRQVTVLLGRDAAGHSALRPRG
jgi:hypothetical protein